MPAKVVEPQGNQAVAGMIDGDPNCGYLIRTDVVDGNGDLKRIPFINTGNRLKEGDLVIFDIDRENYKISDKEGNVLADIAMAVIPEAFFKDNWNEDVVAPGTTVKQRWDDEWEGVTPNRFGSLNAKYSQAFIINNIDSFSKMQKG